MFVTLLMLQGLCQGVVPGGRLTDEEVNATIRRGNHDSRSHQIGLRLVDQQEFFLSGLLCTTCQTSGYVITVYTPEQWIEQAARYARREMAPFTLADVPEEMRDPMLHVVAMPSTPAYLNGNGFSWASSVHRVVMSDTARATTIQPVGLSHGSIERNSAFRSANFTSATVSFFMADVEKLRAADPKGEFFIVVVGDNKNKFFKVKARFMSELFPNGYARSYSPDGSQPVTTPAAGNSSAVLIANSTAGKSSPAAAAATAYSGHAASPQELAELVQHGQASRCTVITNPPGAEVYVDGNKGGTSPLSFVLIKHGDAFRTVTIRLTGYQTIEQQFVPDGKPIPITLALVAGQSEPFSTASGDSHAQEPVKLSQPAAGQATVTFWSSPRGATIELDGNYVGSTPSTMAVPVGAHTVTMSKEGYEPWHQTIKLPSGNVKVNADLNPPRVITLH